MNYFTNGLSALESQYEEDHNYDWDKQIDISLFQLPCRRDRRDPMYESRIRQIENIKNIVKAQMDLTKDYYFLLEESSLHEFLQLFSTMENYLQNLLKELIELDRSKFIRRLRLSSNDEKELLKLLLEGREISPEMREEVVENSIESYLMKNVLFFLDEIMKELPREIGISLKSEIEYDELKIYLEGVKHLRNLHIHHLGVENNTYKRVAGLDNIDNFRGALCRFIPPLDRAVKSYINSCSN